MARARTILSTPPHRGAASDQEEFKQAPEDEQDPPPPASRSEHIHPPDRQAVTNEEPGEHFDADEDWDIIDWIGAP